MNEERLTASIGFRVHPSWKSQMSEEAIERAALTGDFSELWDSLSQYRDLWGKVIQEARGKFVSPRTEGDTEAIRKQGRLFGG